MFVELEGKQFYISCISNMAAGILEQPLSHQEIMGTTEKAKQKFTQIVRGEIKEV